MIKHYRPVGPEEVITKDVVVQRYNTPGGLFTIDDFAALPKFFSQKKDRYPLDLSGKAYTGKSLCKKLWDEGATLYWAFVPGIFGRSEEHHRKPLPLP